MFIAEQSLESKPARKGSKAAARINHLKQKIVALNRDILFDTDAADAAWQPLLIRLRTEHAQNARQSRSKKAGEGLEPPIASLGDHTVDVEDEDDATMLGGMFASDGNEAPEQVPEQHDHDVMRLKDFGKWSGVHPKRVLEETCRTLDSKSHVRLTTISTTTYSCRHKLVLQWHAGPTEDGVAFRALPAGLLTHINGRNWSVEMQNIAAQDTTQSEAYVCTLMLFLVATANAQETKLSNRLPTAWRELFKDLVDSRKDLLDADDKVTLRELRTMLEEKKKQALEQSDSEATKDSKTEPEVSKGRDDGRGLAHSDLPLSGKVERVKQELESMEGRRSKQRVRPRFDSVRARAEWETRCSRTSYQDLLVTRAQLPVHQYRAEILQMIEQHPVVILCSETGSGKSTQVPGFVLEHELSAGRDCHILITQPRRISAISLARRVSQELGESRQDLGTERSLVGYAIRLESKTSNTTRITFATTGVLLRMLESSFELEDIDYLILDEVHERTLDLDLLFIAIRRLLSRRPTFRVVLMSATIDAQKFSEYFHQAPVVDVPGRTFPVEVKFLEDAIQYTLDMPSSRKKLEFHSMTDDLDDFESEEDKQEMPNNTLSAYSPQVRSFLAGMDEYRIDYELITKLASAVATKKEFRKYSKAILIFMPGIAEIRRLHNTLLAHNTFSEGWMVHLLHSSFSTDELERAFAPPPSGMRKIVIATNIAETGITIPDVTAVIDSCKEKVMRFDERRQLSRLTESFISRSSARQRKGRAARVQEGLCFHLVTRHRYENMMLEQHVPEMLRLSLQDPILRVKIWQLGPIEDTLSEAIEPPTKKNIRRAIEKLKDAGALSSIEELTALGQQVARLPLEVPLAKLAIFGAIFRCLVRESALTACIALLTRRRTLPLPLLQCCLPNRLFWQQHKLVRALIQEGTSAEATQICCRPSMPMMVGGEPNLQGWPVTSVERTISAHRTWPRSKTRRFSSWCTFWTQDSCNMITKKERH